MLFENDVEDGMSMDSTKLIRELLSMTRFGDELGSVTLSTINNKVTLEVLCRLKILFTKRRDDALS